MVDNGIICKYLNNYFIHDRSAFHFGEFEIEDLPGSKKPSLTVYPDAKDENARVKVATFVSRENR